MHVLALLVEMEPDQAKLLEAICDGPVDELRVAAALDVPADWRKSLAQESRYTLPDFGDDEGDAESQSAEQRDDDCRGTADA